jgi:cysteine-rich repeat protein
MKGWLIFAITFVIFLEVFFISIGIFNQSSASDPGSESGEKSQKSTPGINLGKVTEFELNEYNCFGFETYNPQTKKCSAECKTTTECKTLNLKYQLAYELLSEEELNQLFGLTEEDCNENEIFNENTKTCDLKCETEEECAALEEEFFDAFDEFFTNESNFTINESTEFDVNETFEEKNVTINATSKGVLPEECDDGNTEDGDGCSSICTIEPDYKYEELRINSGGPSFTDSKEKVWEADHSFTLGTNGGTNNRGDISIAKTENDKLFQTEIYCVDNYDILVTNGKAYDVYLHLAETWCDDSGCIDGAGDRIFSINVEGNQVPSIDVFNEANGRDSAIIKKVTNAEVTDGSLTITFDKNKECPIINAIEILESKFPAPGVTGKPECGNNIIENGEAEPEEPEEELSDTEIIIEENVPSGRDYEYSIEDGKIRLEQNGRDNLGTYKDHFEIWLMYDTLIPREWYGKYVTEFIIFSDGYGGTLAYVEQTRGNDDEWLTAFDINDIFDNGEHIDREETIFTIIHEYAHILTLNRDQVDTNRGGCDTYTIYEGCVNRDSYYYAFEDEFWSGGGGGGRDDFVTNYASSDEAEDMAETFAAFVLWEKPGTPQNGADKKVLFFYRFPELVELRDQIRTGAQQIR